jgi:porin
LLVGEAEFSIGRARLVAGAWGYTQPTDALFFFSDAARNAGIYGTGEYAASDKVSYFLRAGLTDKKLNFVQTYLGAGAVWTGLFDARKDDQLGLAIAQARISSEVVDTGFTKAAETNVELTYTAPLSDRLTLQGDIQYIANPAGAAFIDHAVVLGMRVKFEFGS